MLNELTKVKYTGFKLVIAPFELETKEFMSEKRDHWKKEERRQ